MKKWLLRFASYKEPDDIFNCVANGTKTIETRPVNPESKNNYANIKIGDQITILSLETGKTIDKTAKFVHVYKSVDEMINNEEPKAIFPTIKTRDELRKVYDDVKKKWGSEYKRKLETYGIVAIGI